MNGVGRVAVRSSAIGEDSLDASFAGQHATILNVDSEEALLDAVRTIHASARVGWRASRIASSMGLDGEPRIAIVVQQLIDADVAGVLFTRDPVTGANERVIESVWGLGEGVVSGTVTPDSLPHARRRNDRSSAAPAIKDIADPRRADGGTIEVALTPEDAIASDADRRPARARCTRSRSDARRSSARRRTSSGRSRTASCSCCSRAPSRACPQRRRKRSMSRSRRAASPDSHWPRCSRR